MSMPRMLFVVVALSMLWASSAAAERPATPVQVVNPAPIAVELTNPPSLPLPVDITGSTVLRVEVSNPDTFRFVGFSAGYVQGNATLLGMHRQCQLTFGASARMCTLEEFYKSPSVVTIGESLASYPQTGWIQVEYVSYSQYQDPGTGTTLQLYGESMRGNSSVELTCLGWSQNNSSNWGKIVTIGKVADVVRSDTNSRYSCDFSLTVTCCGPIAQ